MALVDLRGREKGPAASIGWEENGEVVASADVSREGDRLLILSLMADRLEAGEALIRALAEVANAAKLVALDGEPDLYHACGFAADGEDAWILKLDAGLPPEASRAVTLAELEEAIRSAWSAETSDDPATWTPENPARNHCDVTALLVRELLGGEILIANVIKDGRRVERHAWNRLASGFELDLTRSQFGGGEQLGPAQAQEPLVLMRSAERYGLFAARVHEALGL